MNMQKHLILAATLLGGLTACTTSRTDPGTGGRRRFHHRPRLHQCAGIDRPARRAGGNRASIHHELGRQQNLSRHQTRHQRGLPAPRLLWQPHGAPAAGGTTNAPYTRRVWVYVPSQYVAGTPAPFIVVQDGGSYAARMTNILDNMIADHRLPALVAIMINSGGGDAQGSERGLEYDTVSGQYAEFIETEVLPRISRECQDHLHQGSATAGRRWAEAPGARRPSPWAGFHPELYHRILTYSGTFVNQQSPLNPDFPHGAWEYHDHLIAQSARKPLRIWMQVGENDNHSNDPENTFHNWVLANRRMAAALQARGYHYQFVFCKGAGHVDRKAVAQTLPAALAWLWRGYPVKLRTSPVIELAATDSGSGVAPANSAPVRTTRLNSCQARL